jgi:hypothetical protein
LGSIYSNYNVEEVVLNGRVQENYDSPPKIRQPGYIVLAADPKVA